MTNLVLLQPLFKKLLTSLLQHRTSQFERLELVEFALLKQDTEILQNWRQLARRRGGSLECLDRLNRMENAPR